MLRKVLLLIKRIIKRFYLGNKNLLKQSYNQTIKPRWIWFEVTDNCNSHCTHCNIWQKKPTKNTLTLEELEKTFKDPLLGDVETIINSGGEAILHKDILDIIRLQHKIFPKASLDLSTNGILPDRALYIVNTLINEKIKINMGVSLDAIGEKHDQIRGVPGNFKKVDYLLNELVKLRAKYPDILSIVVGLTLSPLTIDGWQEVKKYAEQLKIELMVQWYNESSFYDNEEKGGEIKSNTNKMITAVKTQPNTMIREKWLKLLNDKSIKFRCYAGDSFFVLRCDGNIVPCLSYWDLIMGNVKDNAPSEIWNSKIAKIAREKVQKCPGCINSWGVEWSATSAFYPRLFFYLKNPMALLERINR